MKFSKENLKNSIIQFFKFGIVGFSSTLVSYAVYSLLVLLKMQYLLANALAFIVGTLNSFLWNSLFVFKKNNDTRNPFLVLLKTFTTYGLTNLLLSTLLLALFVERFSVSKYLAPILVLIITVPLNFILNKYWAYKKQNTIDIKQKWLPIFESTLFSVCVFTILFLFLHLAPFGNSTLAFIDGNLTFLDQLAYLKDVLEGKNSIKYTFSQGLGNTYIGNSIYALFSPFNLLLVFFSKENLNIFFNLVCALKIIFACFAMSYFLQSVFKNKLNTLFLIFLSNGYAFCEYAIKKADVNLWLNGVYMLPFIFL